ncbi:NTP transferase domain-containing protein [Micromonospora sp. KC723]|uniref:NTP transferase domain-containing protein n=1 Tax=Micromonospora sp. KC723 TaxID=2530381 RepID=UPI001FB6192B|nr:NTP transferase domain-containing protein [Micromonospora sp. KC723]
MSGSMKVVLFCGGQGLRMRGDGMVVPKPMVTIGGRPLLWHVMRYYAHYGHTEFILCLGHGADELTDYFGRAGGRGWNITMVDTGLQASIGERLMQVAEHVRGEDVFLANYADTLTDAPLSAMVEAFRRGDAAVGLLAVRPSSSHHVIQMGPDGMVSRVDDAGVLHHWENGGYFVMRQQIFDELRPGQDLVPHALNRLAAHGRVLAHRHRGFFRGVDTAKDRIELDYAYRQGRRPWMVWESQAEPAAVAQ